MKKQIYLTHFVVIFILLSLHKLKAQQWDGLTLYSNSNATTAYLVDTNNVTVKTWSTLTGGTGYSSYLTPGGTLVRSVKNTSNVLTGGGMTGRIQKVDYNGNVLWDYSISNANECLHHDHCPLPNGNILVICYDVKTSTDLANAGCTTNLTSFWCEKVLELKPIGTNSAVIVWQWNVWDHLVQNVDPNKANYQSSIVNHPELLNINYSTQKDWLHMNGIDYNPILDQIVVSSHWLNEWYVIDHSTTTAEAASHSGGISGKGGDILYRWGNPAAYQATGTKILNVTHDAHWIPEGHPNAGRLVGFNNQGVSATQSCVDQIMPPLSGYNYTISSGSAYTPASYLQRNSGFGYSSNEGSSEQYPNGNQLVNVAFAGKIYELNPSGTPIFTITTGGVSSQAHRYSNCFINNAAPPQPTITLSGSDLVSTSAASYQWYLNGSPIAGATNQTYTPTQNGIYLVKTTDANACVYMYSANYIHGVINSIGHNAIESQIIIYPNPSNGMVHIQYHPNYSYQISVKDINGKVLINENNTADLDLSNLNNGIYFITVTNEVLGTATKKITILK